MATIKGIARLGVPAAQTEGELVDQNFDEFGTPRVLLVAPDGTDLITTDGVKVQGNVAHDAVDAGSPVKVGGKASTGAPSAVADADRVDANFDEFGNLRTLIVDPANATDLSDSDGVFVQGSVAHDSVDSGRPLKMGGKVSTGNPGLVADDDRVDAHFDARGNLGVMILNKSGTTDAIVGPPPDNSSSSNPGLFVVSHSLQYDETNFDRVRGNTEITVLATAARTASTNSADLINYNARGVIITLDVTTDPAGGETLQLLVQYKDAESSAYEIILDDGANATPGRRTVIVYPGTAGSANDVTSTTGYPLPRIWRVRIVHSAGGTWNYSVGASLIL